MRQKEANPRKITGSLQSQNTPAFFKTEEVKQKFLKFAKKILLPNGSKMATLNRNPLHGAD